MNRTVGFVITTSVLFFTSIALAAASGENGSDPQLQRNDPGSARTREVPSDVELEKADKFLIPYDQQIAEKVKQGYVVYGLRDRALGIQSAVHNEISPVVSIYGDAGSGRTSLLDAYVMQTHDVVWMLDSAKLATSVKKSMTETMLLMRAIIGRVQKLNENDPSKTNVLVIDKPEEFNFGSSGKTIEVVLEAISARRIPMILLNGRNFYNEVLQKNEVVSERVQGFAAENPKLQSLISILRQRRFQLEDFYKQYDVRFADEAIVDLAHQLLAHHPQKVVALGNDVLGKAAEEFIREHVTKVSQIGRWQEEVANLQTEIQSLKRDKNPDQVKIANLENQLIPLQKQLNASMLDGELDVKIQKQKQMIQNLRDEVANSPQPNRDASNKSGWSLFGGFARSQAQVDQATMDLQARITVMEKDLAGLEEQKKASTTTSTPPAEIGKQLIHQVLAKITNRPVSIYTSDLDEAIANLQQSLDEEVFGQDEAKKQLADAVAAARQGLNITEGPAGQFLFAGPSGVGKTELAKALAKQLNTVAVFESMSDYAEKVQVTNFLGGGRGYTGYEDQPAFFAKLKAAPPDAVIILDEVDKAHPDVIKSLIKALGEGYFTNQKGEIVDIRNMTIIMTTNAGTDFLDAIKEIQKITANTDAGEADLAKAHLLMEQFQISEDQLKQLETLPPEQQKELLSTMYKDHLYREDPERFKKEMLGRQDVIHFDYLSQGVFEQVVGKFINQYRARVLNQKKVLSFVSKDAWDHILKQKSDNYGARPLARYIQQRLGGAAKSIKKLGTDKVVIFDFDGRNFTANAVDRSTFDAVASEAGFLKSADVVKDQADAGELGKMAKFRDSGIIPRDLIEKVVSGVIEPK